MKKNLLYLGLTGYLLFALCTRLQAQTDSLQAHRYVTRATMYGVGFTNVFDTYLSPQEYKGIDFRISRETIRMTKLFCAELLSGRRRLYTQPRRQQQYLLRTRQLELWPPLPVPPHRELQVTGRRTV